MTNYDDDPRSTRPGWQILLAAVLILLIGGVLGYGVRAWTSDTRTNSAAPTVTVTATPTTTTTGGTGCVAAAEASAALVEQIEDGVRAIRDLDPETLRGVLDQVQRLQGELERAVADCSGRLGSSPTSTTTAPATTAPTTTTTTR